MSNIFLVKGYLTTSDKEKRILYVGTSGNKSFEFFDKYSKSAEIVVEIWEDGYFVRDFKA